MNELQQVLLVFAVIIVVGLYFFSRQKSGDSKKGTDQTPPAQNNRDTATQSQPKSEPQPQAEQAVQQHVERTTTVVEPELDENYVPDTQAKLPFGDDFELEMQSYPVLELDDMVHESEAKVSEAATKQEPQVFAILVLTSNKEFSLQQVSKTLKDVGLSFSERGTFVKKANNKLVLQVANVMEPGVFPEEPDVEMTTPGVALILELPNSAVPAPRAMDDLIMTARRVSQRLKGRMYDMQRHLVRESDLQAMREAALDYESKKVTR